MKRIKKLLYIILCFGILYLNTNIAMAASSDGEFSITDNLSESRYNSLEEYVEEFIAANNCDQEIESTYPLYDLNDEIIAVLFNLDTGYIIINVRDFSIPEFSFTCNSSYSSDNLKKYYNGAFEYFEENEVEKNYLYDLFNENEVNRNSLITSDLYGSDSRSVDPQTVPNIDQIGISPSIQTDSARASASSQTFSLMYSLPNYSYNPNGICGANAVAMYLRYLDLHCDSNIISSNLSTEISLITYLEDYIPASSDAGDVYFGIMEYYDDRDIIQDIYLSTTNSADVVRCLSSDTPYIAGFIASSSLGAHWATGYSFIEYSTGSAYLIINDGHGNSGIYMNITQSDMIIG
ncbi:MAG: hypothetical protein WCD89_21485 [Anaerocolumna sp.]